MRVGHQIAGNHQGAGPYGVGLRSTRLPRGRPAVRQEVSSGKTRTKLDDRKSAAFEFLALPWARQMGNLSANLLDQRTHKKMLRMKDDPD